jgi:hypothetical protein
VVVTQIIDGVRFVFDWYFLSRNPGKKIKEPGISEDKGRQFGLKIMQKKRNRGTNNE